MSNSVNESKDSYFEQMMVFNFAEYIMNEENYIYTVDGREKKLMLFWHYYFLTVGEQWVNFQATQDEQYKLSDRNLFKWSYLFYKLNTENSSNTTQADDEMTYQMVLEQMACVLKENLCIVGTLILEIPRVVFGLVIAGVLTAIHCLLWMTCSDFNFNNFYISNIGINIATLFQNNAAETLIKLIHEILECVPNMLMAIFPSHSENHQARLTA